MADRQHAKASDLEGARVIPLRASTPRRQRTAARSDGDGTVVSLPGANEPADHEAGADGGTVSGLVDFLRSRLTGAYQVDDFGFDRELTETALLPLARLLYDNWFRVSVYGAHHLPTDGAALVMGNHSGTVPLDAVMTTVAVHDEHPTHRHLRVLGDDLLFGMPFVGQLARKSGHTLACHADATRLLSAGELVGTFPEGVRGVGKPFRSRYKLQRFGKGGFASAAARTSAPIVPCAIVGAEEIYPKIGDLTSLARLLGLPYFPVTPFFPLLGPLGAVPLPTKWHIEFGAPIDTTDVDHGDRQAVEGVTDRAREAIQQLIDVRLATRSGVFGD